MKHSSIKDLKWLWNNIEAIFFFIFFATFPFNIRKVFLTKYSYLNGEFNEYLTISFGWADLLIVVIVIIYTIKWLLGQAKTDESKVDQGTGNNANLHNKNEKKSRSILSLSRDVLCSFHTIIGHLCQVNKFKHPQNVKIVSRETIFLFLFIGWAVISISWSPLKEIALYRALSIVEMATMAFLVLNFARQNRNQFFLIETALVLAGTIQTLIAVSQFALNKSLGARFLGESILGADSPGVAKFILEGVKHIRAYGTFPHPNILAGFLLIPIFILLGLLSRRFEMKRSQLIVSRETVTSKIPASVLVILLAFLTLGLFITFSRSALLALGLGGFIFWWQKPKPSSSGQKSFWLALLILALFLTGSLVSQTKFNFIFSGQSFKERNFYLKVSRETISEKPARGAGIGQFVLSEYRKYPNLPGWQYQPVHNLYLLIFSELGAIGFILFLLFLINIVRHPAKNTKEKATPLTNWSYYCLIISFLFLAFFDHYFWDIKPGMIVFTLPFILYLANSPAVKKSST